MRLTPVVGWTTLHSIIEWKDKWYLFHHDSVPSDGTIETIEGFDD